MKPSFLNLSTAPIVAMIQCRTAAECIEKIGRSLAAGAEAFGIQLCKLVPEERTEENIRAVFAACGDRPIYITSYRTGSSQGLSDEECRDLLLKGLRCGATLCDIPGDFFDKNDYQISFDGTAVAKQKELADFIRAHGGEVLMSTHDFRDLSGDEIFAIAEAQAKHGADVLKIVVRSADPSRLPEYISTIDRVRRAFGKPFLFLDSGSCSRFLRMNGGALGSCMLLCVESYNDLDTPSQPLISDVLQLRRLLAEEK